jgi:hypothetical protein
MIYAFLIHSADNVNSVLFSHFYTGEGNDKTPGRLQGIIRKVIQDKSFQQHAASYFPTRLDLRTIPSATINSLTTSKKVSETYPSDSASTTSRLSVPKEGIVFLPGPGRLAAIWNQFGNLTFTVVCEQSADNLVQVSKTVLLIVEHVCRRFGVNKLEKSIAEQPDEVEHIITSYFRVGSPTLINFSLHRAMVKADDGQRPFLD